MAAILFKWFFLLAVSVNSLPGSHPIFVSVTEIDHNKKEKTLEISCRIFTDDFEKTLRSVHNSKIDLLDESMREAMYPVVNNYITKHLKIFVNGQPVKLKWIGYEPNEEGIVSYLQADNIPEVKSVTVIGNLLYEYKKEQISLLHVTVNGTRKSYKLNNPEDKVVFEF
jgi:hypothetical protein